MRERETITSVQVRLTIQAGMFERERDRQTDRHTHCVCVWLSESGPWLQVKMLTFQITTSLRFRLMKINRLSIYWFGL